jgi:MFS family permease
LGAIAGGVALAIFFVHRCRVAADPLLDLELLGDHRFALVTVVTLLYSAAFFGTLFTFMLFLTGPWHLSLTMAGLALTPMPATALLLTAGVGALSDRVGFRIPLAAGTACISLGLGLSSLIDRGGRFQTSWLALVVLIGFGVGLCYPLLSAAAVAGQRPTNLAAATAVNQCARQVGAALGVAGTVAALGAGSTASVSGFHTAWLLCCVCAGLAATAALRISRA